MKKQILLFTLIAGIGYISLESYSAGPGSMSLIRNGAKGNPSTCSDAGCHGGTVAPTLAIRVDSVGGVEVSKYVAGMSYTVTVTGSHATNTKFGFQFSAVTGTGSSQVQAGSVATTGLPSQVVRRTVSSIQVVEQSSTITGPLSKSFVWTAPSTGSDDVTMYLTVNAVNGNGAADAGDASGNVSVVLPQHTPTGIRNVVANQSLAIFPNPAVNEAWLTTGEPAEKYLLTVVDAAGKLVLHNEVVTDATGKVNIATVDFASGTYFVSLSNATARFSSKLLKQ